MFIYDSGKQILSKKLTDRRIGRVLEFPVLSEDYLRSLTLRGFK